MRDEPLRRHTSLKVGGAADLFAVPRDLADLQDLLEALKRARIPWMVIGGGFNLLVRDGGWRGAAISLKNLDRMECRDGLLYLEAGATIRAAAGFARDHGLSGLEFLAGIPGTVGGALRMNAGAHGSELFDRVERVHLLTDCTVEKYPKTGLNYGYRRLQLEHDQLIIAAEISGIPGSRESISGRMEKCLATRAATQKVGLPNAGSFFKNPEGQAAWRLIDEAGLRGVGVGGAQVSEVHTNFLVNRGGATAADFLALAARIKERVLAVSGIALEEEVIIVGEDPR